MFAFARQVALHVKQQERHIWRRSANYFVLSGSTVTIVGLGAIGRTLGERCRALGMRVIAVSRDSAVPEYVAKHYDLSDLKLALSESKHVAVTISPLAGNGRPLFSAAEFDAMLPGSYFYNLSRGSLVDQNALESAMKGKKLAGAGLDVFAEEPLAAECPLWDMDNILISPHAGGRFVSEIEDLTDLFLNNLHQYRANRPLANLVISNV